MTEFQATVLLASVGAVALYPIIATLLLRVTQGTRDELAALGRDLLQAPRIDEEHKRLISAMLDDVFDWQFMALACLYFPALVFRRAFGSRSGMSAADAAFCADPRVLRFFDLHMKAVAAAAPIWTVVFYIVALGTMTLAIAFIGLSLISQLYRNGREIGPER